MKLRHSFVLSAALRLSSGCTPVAEGKELDQPVEATEVVVDQEEARAELLQAAPAAPAVTTITISAIGDNTLGGPVGSEHAKGSFQHLHSSSGADFARPFSAVLKVLEADDLTIGNLEGPLTDQGCRTDHTFAFRGEPAFAEMLKRGSVEVVSLANNHAEDCGSKGVADTRTALQAHGVGHFGLGVADVRTVRGIEVVNLGFTGGNLSVKREVVEAIKAHRKPDNLVIVSFHWGIEGTTSFSSSQQTLGRAAIDAGADLVLGHHPHVLQGIENYKGKRIVYSLGNFVFGGNGQPSDLDTMIFRARFSFSKGALSRAGYEIVPAHISGEKNQNDFRPVLVSGSEAEAIRAKVVQASPLGEAAAIF